MTDRSVVVRLKGITSDFQAAMGRAGQSVKQLRSELDAATKTEKGRHNLDQLANSAIGMGAGLMAGFGLATAAAARFDKQMSAVAAVSNASTKELDQLRAAALQAGKDTQFSATEAAKAQEELAKAGISTADILGGALSGSLALAAAGTLDLSEASDIAAKTMNVFKLSGGDVGHIADVLAAGANKSATDVHELGEALKMGGLAASNAGLDLEDTVGTLSAFADRALVGSDAGTSLKTMLQMLANPSKESAALMERLGINAYDAAGNFVGITKMADILRTKLGTLTQEQRNQALAQIFGADATRAATVLYELGAEGVEKYITAVDDMGAAQDVAQKKTDNLAGDIERLTGSIETLAIESGSGANGGLRLLVQAADDLVGAFSDLPDGVQTTAVVIAGLAGVGLLAAGGFVKVRNTALEALGALREMGPAGSRAADGLGRVGKVAGQATVWGIAIFGAYEGIKLFVNFLNSDVKGATRNVDDMARSLVELGKTGEAVGELRKAFGGDLRKLTEGHTEFVRTQREMSTALHESKNGLDELGRAIVANNAEQAGLNDKQHKRNNDFIESTKAMDKALADLVSKGGATQAKMAFEALADVWVRSGKPLSELNALLPGYNKAIGDVAAASGGAALGFGNVEQNARTMTGTLQEAIKAGQSLKDVFDQLNGGLINSMEAQIQVEAAFDDLTASLTKNGQTLDINSEAGRANQQAILDVATAARDATQAKYDETGSLEQAKVTYDGYKQKLYETLRQANFTEEAAHALADQWMKMPPLASTTVQAPGLPQTRADAAEAFRLLNNLNGKVVNTYLNNYVRTYYEDGRSSMGNSRYGRNDYATGGIRRAAVGMVLAPNDPGVVLASEPQTGGEVLTPLKGISKARAMDLVGVVGRSYGFSVVDERMGNLSRAASYGTSVAAGGSGGGGLSPNALAQALARELGPMIAALADRPQITELTVGAEKLARVVRQGNRSLERQG